MQPTAIIATAEIATAQAMGADTKKIIAFAVLAFALVAGTAAVMMTVQPQHAVADSDPQC